MNKMKHAVKISLMLLTFICIICACQQEEVAIKEPAFDMEAHKNDFIETLEKHLDAVTNKDLESLKETLAPTGELYFMLDERETSKKASDFIKFHEDWFQDTTWSFETEITDVEVGRDLGLAITQLIYREPERNGKPYFNRMAVSYTLKSIDGQWYIIKDHATSIERAK